MWRVIAFGFLLNLSSTFGQTHFVSLFTAQIRDSFGLSHGQIGGLYSAATLCSAATLPWAGKLIDSIDLRKYAAGVALGLALAILWFSFADALWQLALAFFLLRLFGQGLSSHTGFTATTRLATVNRGKAISISGLGISAGEAVAPAAVAALLVMFAWRELWQLAAVFQIIIILSATQFLLFKLSTKTSAAHSQLSESDNSWTRKQVLKDKRFWLAAPAIFAPPCVVTGLFFHQYSLAQYQQVDFTVWTAGVTAYPIASVIASLIAGKLTDKFSGGKVIRWALWPLIITVMLPIGFNFAGLSFLYYGLMGLGVGIGVPAVNAMWVEIYGKKHLGAIRAFAHAMMVLFSSFGPVAYGVLLDAGISWSYLLALTAVYMIIANFALWRARLTG